MAGTADRYQNHGISQEMEAGTLERHEGRQPAAAMSGFNTRLPTAVLSDARAIARRRGMTTGAWMREVIEAVAGRRN